MMLTLMGLECLEERWTTSESGGKMRFQRKSAIKKIKQGDSDGRQ